MRAPLEHTCRIPFPQRVNERGKRHPQGWRFLLHHHLSRVSFNLGHASLLLGIAYVEIPAGFRQPPTSVGGLF